MVIENVDEFWKFREIVGPNSENIVQESEIKGGLKRAFDQGFSFPLAHVEIGVGRGKSLTHGCPVHQETELVIEEEVIVV